MPGPIFSSDNLQQAIMNTPQVQTEQVQPQAAPPSSGPKMWPTYLAMGAGAALDGVTSNMALRQPGAHEQNLLMGGSPLSNAISKAGSTAAFMFLVHKLAQSGHPDAAKVLGYLSAGTSGAAGGYNIGQLNK